MKDSNNILYSEEDNFFMFKKEHYILVDYYIKGFKKEYGIDIKTINTKDIKARKIFVRN